jgi:hypothetical protein
MCECCMYLADASNLSNMCVSGPTSRNARACVRGYQGRKPPRLNDLWINELREPRGRPPAGLTCE